MSTDPIAPCDYDPPASMVYLSGALSKHLAPYAHRPDLGVMVQPGTRSYLKQVAEYGIWAMDNGCFAERKPNAKPFDVTRWWSICWELDPRACLFVTAPDVVGDARATWERSAPWLARIQELELPAALVAQNGIESTPIEWEAFDTLFIGGDDAFKDSAEALDLIAEAQAQGKWAHVGRVNTRDRFDHFARAQTPPDSADGTMLAFGFGPNWAKLRRWLTVCECPTCAPPVGLFAPEAVA